MCCESELAYLHGQLVNVRAHSFLVYGPSQKQRKLCEQFSHLGSLTNEHDKMLPRETTIEEKSKQNPPQLYSRMRCPASTFVKRH